MRKIFVTLAATLFACSSALAFSDVSSDNGYKTAIDYLAKQRVVSGFSDGEFKPQQRITRAELAKIVVGARGESPSVREFKSCFDDVANEWYARFVCFAKNSNWLSGYTDGKFRPGAEVNRAEAAKIIVNALGLALDDSENFSDVNSNVWYAPYANTVRARNLLDATTFAASTKITRGEVAQMIYRTLVIKKSGASKFTFGLIAGFDTRTKPATIISSTLDFANAQNSNLALSKWQITNGVWMLKPALEFNGGTYYFATPQDYVAAIKTIQKHFALLGFHNFDSSLTKFISEFQNVLGRSSGVITPTIIPAKPNTAVGIAANFTGVDLANESAVAGSGGAFATFNNSKIYVGYEVLAPLNYNPVVVSFTNGRQNWVRRDYETSSDESLAYGILWTDANSAFVVFTSRGIEENITSDFRRFTRLGWLSDYGIGSGHQIAVVTKINPADGGVQAATFLSAREPSGTTNSLIITGLKMYGSNLIVSADAWVAPRRVNTQPMDKKLSAGNEPFAYEIEFTPNLQTAVRAVAPTYGQ
ncbi:MAG: S-layer homology domain-containing protein [Patescibacteria group bacterium]